MSDQRLGAAFRVVRLRRGWRQMDVATRAGVSDSLVSSIERGRVSTLTIESLRRVAAVLDIRIDVQPRWRGADLDRLLNARHSALGDAVARMLRDLGWEVAVEVSFSISGERGFIDLLAWNAATRTLLVIELKTEIVEVQELIGIVDRKTRLAARVGRQRGWLPATVATWVVIAEGSTNRHRVDRFSGLLRTAFPDDGRMIQRWLAAPSGRVAALSFFSDSGPGGAKSRFAGRQRVRAPKSNDARRR